MPDAERRARHRSVLDRPWSGCRQVHGDRVAVISAPGEQAGDADALVSATPGVALSVLGADCPTIAMASPQGVIAAVHAGWRGLLAGVIESASNAMASLGAQSVVAALGPCAHVECYEFSGPELSQMSELLGPEVVGRTRVDTPALDLPLAVARAAERAGVEMVAGVDRCTICAPEYFSHRHDGDPARQALVVWQC